MHRRVNSAVKSSRQSSRVLGTSNDEYCAVGEHRRGLIIPARVERRGLSEATLPRPWLRGKCLIQASNERHPFTSLYIALGKSPPATRTVPWLRRLAVRLEVSPRDRRIEAPHARERRYARIVTSAEPSLPTISTSPFSAPSCVPSALAVCPLRAAVMSPVRVNLPVAGL